MANTVVIGTRGSDLAMWQARHVQSILSARYADLEISIQTMTTQGDQIPDAPLWAAGGKSFFTKEIDHALLAGDIDIAVHSLKDLETQSPDGIAIAAVPERENPSDALLSRNGQTLADLPLGSTVGTSSLRRRAFLLSLRPDLVIATLRGNVPTRVQKLEAGDFDAVVLATAGLNRLGLASKITSRLPLSHFLPAVSQGALAICCRSDDGWTKEILASLNDEAAFGATTAERALLNEIEGGCHAPLGALGEVKGNDLTLNAVLCAPDGQTKISASANGSVAHAEAIGRQAAHEILDNGGVDLLKEIERQVEDLKNED